MFMFILTDSLVVIVERVVTTATAEGSELRRALDFCDTAIIPSARRVKIHGVKCTTAAPNVARGTHGCKC